MQALSTDHRAVPPASAPHSYDATPPASLPYTPLPQRRGAGSTGALVAVALLIPALIVGLLSLRDGDEGGGDTVARGSAPESDSGPVIEGSGYAYTVPDGWKERTRWAHDVAGETADSAVAVSRPDHGFDTNVLVTASDAGGVSSVEEARDDWLPVDGAVEPLRPTSIDGVDAIGIRRETVSDGGRPIVQLGYLTLRNGQLYSIVLSVPVQSERGSQVAFDAVLESWSWGADEESAPSTA